MNPKIKAIDSDIEKTRAKVTELQSRLRELEQRKTELENTDIISLVRGMKLGTGDLERFLEAYTEQAAKTPVPTIENAEEIADDEM